MATKEGKDFTKGQLEDRFKGLNQIVNILTENNIPYRLAGGSLLGIYRDKAFIPWDADVDIWFNVNDILKKTDSLISILRKHGFQVYNIHKEYNCFSFRASKYLTSYDFEGFHEKGNYMLQLPKWNIGWKYPTYLFNSLGTIEFKGSVYTTFSDIESYLSTQYGNWQIPKKSRYLSYKIRTNYFNPLTRAIMKIKQLFKIIKKS